MGREWFYTGNRKKPKNKNTSSSGCMNVIFNLFDVQHHQFRFHHPSFMSESTINNQEHSNSCLQGIQAPRSSLDSPESAINGAPSSSKVKEQTNLNIPVGKIQLIKTKQSKFTEELSSESCNNSPGTKTPNLVARLMGLDLLPEYSSPRPSSSSAPATSNHHTRSLPATPRISTASRRRSTDNDYHHRLSLQIDKENCNSCAGRLRPEVFPVSRREEELKSQYAKEITNQVRERISRRLGNDITNTVSPASFKDQRRDSNLVLLKPKKTPAVNDAPVKLKPDEPSRLANLQKLRLLDIKSNLNKPASNSHSHSHSSSVKEVKSPKVYKPVKDEKIKRIASERYDLRLKKKSTTLPNDHVLNVKNTTKIMCFKKEMTSSYSKARSSSQLQVSLPSNSNPSYKLNNPHNLTTTTAIATDGGSFSDHFDYISKILNQCGITSNTPISSGQWYSHSHPLHPTIFPRLQNLRHPTATTTTAGKMIFELVDEYLVEILNPYMNQNPWVCSKPPEHNSCVMYGSDLIGKLCKKIGSFPAVHCEVLEDIDGLIERDMGRDTRRLLTTSFKAEVEEIVKELEGEIVENLVHEIVTEITTVAPAGKF